MHPEEPPGTDSSRRTSALRSAWVWATLVALLALVVYPFGRRIGAPGAASSITPLNQLAQNQDQQILLNLSWQHYQAGRYEEAIQDSQAVLKINPASADAYNNLAVAYLGLRMYDEAIHNGEQALRLNPNYQLARNNLAWIRQEQAKAGNRNAAPPAPATPQHLLDQSLAYYQAGRYQECIDAARQALKLRPNFAEAYNNIGAAYASLGKWDEAILAAREAIRLKPDFQLAKNNLAWAESAKKGKR
jgi:protein O-mannosyl-transferase